MAKKEKCNLCHEDVDIKYIPMIEWNIDGVLCSRCYSKKISEFYPGEHVRVNLDND